MPSQKTQGFTLIEVLLALCLLALVAAAVTSALVQGIKIYHRIRSVSGGEETAFFLERLTRDLKNQATLSSLAHSFSSTGFASAVTDMNGLYPLLVEYRFIPEKDVISRSVSEYPYAGRREMEVLSGVKSVHFDWTMVEQDRSSAVTLTLEGERGGTTTHVIRIPVGYDALKK